MLLCARTCPVCMMDLHLYPCLACLSIFSLVASATGAMSANELPEHDLRIQVPLPSADVCTQRIELSQMILSLSSITDQEKYSDVIASVQKWHDLDIMSFVTILAERTHGEPMSDENKAVQDAGEGYLKLDKAWF